MVGKGTTGSSFGGLAKYLTQNEERVAWSEPRWMIGTDPQEVAREMEAAAAMSGRAEKPVYHISISFSEADQPTREQMVAAADRVLHELGMGEHQALFVAHQDKDHPHLHIMVNRVHPDTGKAADIAFDYRKIETVLRDLEKEWGMKQVPGHHARGAGEEPPDRTQALSTGEMRSTRRTGELPFPQEIRERMGDELSKAIENAKNWSELKEALGRYGYRIEPTERGMKITDGERYAKASSVDERLSRFGLEKRFGEPLRSEPPLARNAAPATERVSDLADSRPSMYESLFGKPALERDNIPQSPGSGQILGAAAVAARPVSGEDGEKEVPFRVLEMGLRSAAAFASDTRQRGSQHPAQVKAASERSSAGEATPSGTVQEQPVVDRSAAERQAVIAAQASPTPDPEVRQLAEDVKTYKRAIQAEQGLRVATGSYAEAEGQLKAAQRQQQEVTRLSQTFDRALGEAYRNPDSARRAFETLADQRGPEVAARMMRQEPERFGAVATTERKKWLGMASEVSKADSYAAARGAANVGEQYLHSRAALPSPLQRAGLEQTLAARGAEMKGLSEELARIGSPSKILDRIGKQARGFTTAQMAQLGKMLTADQMGVVMKAVGIPVKVARGYGR